jgi:superfamily II RNA helicase
MSKTPSLGLLLRGRTLALGRPLSADELLELAWDWAAEQGLSLYPAQEEAMLELFEGKNVILNTPTGSGKSTVASMLILDALNSGRRAAYTCPIKALVNEKWMALCREFGPENVGLATGDASVNRDAPILCCTAEILANMALGDGENCAITDVVVDEFHYYSDRERGGAWQIPLLTMSKARFLLMSATLGDTSFFESELNRLTGRETALVKGVQRPVPLEFSYSETPLSNCLQGLVHEGKAPVYVVHFTQAEAARNAQNFTSLDLCTKEERALLAKELQSVRFASPYGPDLKRWLRLGIGLHHAGLLPKYRILVEKLAQRGLLKVICGTDTLGVGVNVPIRTVLFTQLCKYSGDKVAILTSRDFHQVAGRAGRKGFDNVGYVVAQAPEFVIENKQLEAKAAQNGRKFQKKKPPEKGFVHWDKAAFERLIESQPEKLVSRFQVSHGMLLHVLSRPTDGCQAMRQLIRDCHDTPKQKKAHQKRAFQLFRALIERGIVEWVQNPEPGKAKVRVNADLQSDFAMHQVLSLYLMDTIAQLDKNHPEYHLDILSLAEAIVDNPEVILRAQLAKIKSDAMAEMKAAGIEYEERMERLEGLEYTKPLRDFIYGTFNLFADQHPWVSGNNIQPKSIVREMFEEFLAFSGYIKKYGLERSEGLLLRHINNVYKVLAHTVPDEAKSEALIDIENYLEEMLRRVDSSLLEEWEKLQNPDFVTLEESEELPPGAEEALKDVTRDAKSFLAAVRMRIFELLAALSRKSWDEAMELLCEEVPEDQKPMDQEGTPWTPLRLQQAVEAYELEHESWRMDPEGRALRYTLVDKERLPGNWYVEQMLQDHKDYNDGVFVFCVDMQASKAAQCPVIQLLEIRH